MSLLEVQSQIGPDGVLSLSIPTGKENANMAVRVMIVPVEAVDKRKPMTQEEWQQFILETAGSIDDPTFVRPDQGTYEQREELFP